jgi:hypothetical protein
MKYLIMRILVFLLFMPLCFASGSQISLDLFDVTCDFNRDFKVNIEDLAILSQNWLEKTDPNSLPNICDINKDSKVDVLDLQIFSFYWQRDLYYFSEVLYLDQEPNNISGILTLGFTNPILSYHLVLEGKQYDFPVASGESMVSINTYEFTNGFHELIFYAVDSNQLILAREFLLFFKN